MSYASKDTSLQDAIPVYLYEFVQGGTTFRYTSTAEVFSWNGASWLPAAIVTSRFSFANDVPKDKLSITVPLTLPLATTFVGYTPDAVTSITIRRTHYDDSEALVYWIGEVRRAIINDSTIQFDCESLFAALERTGVGEVYQRTCRHLLFGDGCKLDADDYAESITVTGVAGNGTVLTIPGVSGMADLTGGTFLASDGTMRTIISHQGTTIVLMKRIKSLIAELVASPSGFSATVYPSCDHTMETCDTKYHNMNNYGGQMGIGTNNPMGGANVF